MPHAKSEGASIHFEETGQGAPILFLHEYAGDHRSWADQVRHFSRGYRCISMSARGYPPSDVPATDAEYGQDISNRDAIAVLDHLRACGISRTQPLSWCWPSLISRVI